MTELNSSFENRDFSRDISDLNEEEPWIGAFKVGNQFTKGSSTVPCSLAAKQALLYHVLEKQFYGGLHNKRLLDIGSNQGYTTLEGLMRGASVVAIEPYAPNRKKTELIVNANGFCNQAKVLDEQMENISKETLGTFDAVMFLGTIYHAEKPWEICKNIAEMTSIVMVESQVIFKPEVNDKSLGYEFKAFEEGPGSEFDDPKKIIYDK